MFRFRDDVTAITDREEFEICCEKIYPPPTRITMAALKVTEENLIG